MRAAPTPGAGATGESESNTTGSTSSQKFVAFGGATQPPRSSERACPSVSLMRLTPHPKPFPTLTAAQAAPSSANSPPFEREPRRVTRHNRLQSRNAPRGTTSAPEREDPTSRVPGDSSNGGGGDGHRFRNKEPRSTSRGGAIRHARGRRERAWVDHESRSMCDEARAHFVPCASRSRARRGGGCDLLESPIFS